MKIAFKYSAATIMKLYSSQNGGPINTRLLLATAMREGKIRVKAEQRWESEERSLLHAWKIAPALEAKDDGSHWITCKRDLWWRSVRWLEDVYDWDFARGRLVVTVQEKPLKRIFLKRVRFHSGDVKKALLGNGVPGNSEQRSDFNTKEKWRAFWHEIVILAAGSRDNVATSSLSKYTSDEKLMDEILQRIQTDDEIASGTTFSDEEFAEALANRSKFTLSEESVKQEIKAFRQALKLKSWGKNAANK